MGKRKNKNVTLQPKLQVGYSSIPTEMFCNYLKFLIGKFFKILPMKEQKDNTLPIYLDSLLLELSGSRDLIEELKHDGNFIVLLSTLQYFTENPDECVDVYRREVFKCISIIKKIKIDYMLE